MKGLFRNNIYSALANIKLFSLIMLSAGIFVVAVDNKIPFLITGYILLALIGFPFIALAGLSKEGAAKWNKYKLVTPVKRSDIVRSYFISQVLWLFTGLAFAGTAIALFVMLHGFPYASYTAVFAFFVVGNGISLFMGAIFFPLFFMDSGERSEVFLVTSLLCSIGIIMWLSSMFPDNLSVTQVILGGMAVLALASLAFILSCPLAVWIYRQKEY